ncbi:hypothetical protein HELRODRAFT_190369 [Helobdella robusta]|uniref:G-protein coupled receptors family 1 profile domain-containing protein n=1 Tax=Helobdella robusta TaxID=6412 RepID=T1FRX8_HELRO|nr:hypothetical protein HELRODRAFT_190369 [Helobdella robusta]ESO10073.1 hypothetical protein HELRODRAFT_190369 [Helobdella robusta]
MRLLNDLTTENLLASNFMNAANSRFATSTDAVVNSSDVATVSTNKSADVQDHFLTLPASDISSLYSKNSALIKSIILIIAGTVNCLGNSMTLIALKRHVSSMRKLTAALVASLSISAIICGWSVYYQAYWNLRMFYLETPPCTTKVDLLQSVPFQQLTPVLVYFQVVLLCVERYLAIVHPFHYETLVTMTHVKLTIFASAVVTALYIPTYVITGTSLCATPYTDTQISTTLFSFFIVVTGAMIFTYSRILVVAIQQRKKISSETVKNTTVIDGSILNAASSNGQERRTVKQNQNQLPTKKQEFKAAKSVAVIVGFFFLCWTPLVLIRAVKLITNMNLPIIFYLSDIAIVCCQVNISLTWLVYGTTDKNMKIAF